MQLYSDPADQLIVALDGMSPEEALLFISRIPDLRWVKVGLELFLNAGPDFLIDLRKKGLKIFLDLKFHDIPVTMAAACREAAKTGAELITVHACAGLNALLAAQESAIAGAERGGLPAPTLLAVTVLTSWDANSFAEELSITECLEDRVVALADLAKKAGIGGCVCSPLEVSSLRRNHPEPFELVTPGIRPLGCESGDQSRVMSPADALKAGASRLVIGRPITRSINPANAFSRCCDELVNTH